MYLNGMVEYVHEKIDDINCELREKWVDYTVTYEKLIKQINFHSAILK